MTHQYYNCTHCEYSSFRKYNTERHMTKVHNMIYIPSKLIEKNIDQTSQNIEEIAQNIEEEAQIVDSTTIDTDFKCDSCYKTFSLQSSVKRHKLSCKKINNKNECEFCHKIYSHRSVLSHHRKKCIKKPSENITIDNKIKTTEHSEIINTIEIKNNTNKENDNKIDDISKVTNTNKVKNKKKIPQSVRIAVWDKYIGLTIGQKLCDICNTNNINQFNFHCAHVIAEINGGAATIENMRPICQSCNLSMGKINLNDYTKLYFNK